MDSIYPDAEMKDSKELLRQAAAIRASAQRSDDPSSYQREMAEADRLETQAKALMPAEDRWSRPERVRCIVCGCVDEMDYGMRILQSHPDGGISLGLCAEHSGFVTPEQLDAAADEAKSYGDNFFVRYRHAARRMRQIENDPLSVARELTGR